MSHLEPKLVGRADGSKLKAVRRLKVAVDAQFEFDLALFVPDDLPVARVEQVMRAASGELLERLALLSEFRGGPVPAGLRSLAWRLTFRHPERTVSAKEIEGRRSNILRQLEKTLNVRQRTS